jgi:hypothetical protein
LDWKGLKIKKSIGNRKIIMSDKVRRTRSDIGSERVNPHVHIFLFADLFISWTTFHPNNCLVRERHTG